MSAKLELTLTAGPQAASAARVALQALEQELGPALIKDLRLMVSELVTNSIRHASSDPRDVVELRAWQHDDRFRIEVSDGGPEFTPIATRGRGDEAGGWGLYIVESLADRWGVERHGRRNCVWLEMDVDDCRTPRNGSSRSAAASTGGSGKGGAQRRRPRFTEERDNGPGAETWAGMRDTSPLPRAAA